MQKKSVLPARVRLCILQAVRESQRWKYSVEVWFSRVQIVTCKEPTTLLNDGVTAGADKMVNIINQNAKKKAHQILKVFNDPLKLPTTDKGFGKICNKIFKNHVFIMNFITV